MLQVPTGTGNASPEAPRLSASLSKLGTEALKKAAAPAPPRPLLQPSAADRKEPAMFENEETKVRGPLPPSRAKRLHQEEVEMAQEIGMTAHVAADMTELSAQRSQLEEERAQFLKQRKELRAREIELQVLRDDADGEIQRLKDEAAKERQKYVEAHGKLTQERLHMVRLREIFHDRTQSLRGTP